MKASVMQCAPLPVTPSDFVSAMLEHWTTDLNNVSSKKLEQLWHTMGQTYVQAQRAAFSEDCSENFWRVLQPPTGTGKTRGLIVYSALTVVENLKALTCSHPIGDVLPTGILIVTRLKAQADEIARDVNALVTEKYWKGRDPISAEQCGLIAIAHHEDSQRSIEEMTQAHVLVITHAAYVNAVERIDTEASLAYQGFTCWGAAAASAHFGRRRLLTVVDEALGSVVNTSQATYVNVQKLLTLFGPSDPLRKEHPTQFEILEGIREMMLQVGQEEMDGSHFSDTSRRLRDLLGGGQKSISFAPLKVALKHRSADVVLLGKNSLPERIAVIHKLRHTLDSIETLCDRWSFFAKEGHTHSLNTSAFIVPRGLNKPVCLDATAKNFFLWELLEGQASIIPTPQGTRSYSRVLLHIGEEDRGLGREAMHAAAKPRAARLLEHFGHILRPTNKLLIVCHKRTKPFLESYLEPGDQPLANADKTYRLALQGGGTCEVFLAHWGKIDGLNVYQQADTVCIFGLPYLPGAWAFSMFFALRGYNKKQFKHHIKYKGRVNFKALMEHRQMAVSVIQAINRARCRRVVDEAGNCDPTHVFISLPHRSEGPKPETEVILEAITGDMPGIQAVPWSFKLDGPAARLRANGKAAPTALLSLMDTKIPGEYPLPLLAKELSISTTQRERIQVRLNDPDDDLTRAMADLGWSYVPGKPGRGNPSKLVKGLSAS